MKWTTQRRTLVPWLDKALNTGWVLVPMDGQLPRFFGTEKPTSSARLLSSSIRFSGLRSFIVGGSIAYP
jgi:hypothetical protein